MPASEKPNYDECPQCGDPDFVLVVTTGIYHCLACGHQSKRIPEMGFTEDVA